MEVNEELMKYDESGFYPIQVREFRLIFQIPRSSFHDKIKYETVAAKNIYVDSGADFYSAHYFTPRCFPNGDCEKNHGYISLKFEECLSKLFYEPCSLHVTFALIDNERNLRFPQSFVVDYKENSNHSRYMGLSRYIKRSTLIDSNIFNAGYLIVQCEVQYYRRNIFSDDWEDPFSWPTEDINKRLGKILSDNSPYFKILMKDGSKDFLRELIHRTEALTLMKKVLTNTDQILENIDDAYGLYFLADFAWMPELKQKCRDYFKTNMKPEMVFKFISLADMHWDDDLKKFVCKYVMRHFNNRVVLNNFNILRLKRPDLAQEILDFGKIEELMPRKHMEVNKRKVTVPEVEVISKETSQTGAKNVRHVFEFYQ